jgi:hypothetical protein
MLPFSVCYSQCFPECFERVRCQFQYFHTRITECEQRPWIPLHSLAICSIQTPWQSPPTVCFALLALFEVVLTANATFSVVYKNVCGFSHVLLFVSVPDFTVTNTDINLPSPVSLLLAVISAAMRLSTSATFS